MPKVAPEGESPPAKSTRPSGSTVALAAARAGTPGSAGCDTASVAGSKASGVVTTAPLGPKPPAISTVPLGSSVAVCCRRGKASGPGCGPTGVPLPETSSSADGATLGPLPPASSQRPSGSSVAVWPAAVGGATGKSCSATTPGRGA